MPSCRIIVHVVGPRTELGKLGLRHGPVELAVPVRRHVPGQPALQLGQRRGQPVGRDAVAGSVQQLVDLGPRNSKSGYARSMQTPPEADETQGRFGWAGGRVTWARWALSPRPRSPIRSPAAPSSAARTPRC